MCLVVWMNLEARRSGRGPPRMPPREGRHRRKDQGAFCRDGTLTRAGDCSLVRAWTAAPSRRLRGGIARGTRAPFSPLLRRPPSDGVSIRSGSTGWTSGSRNPSDAAGRSARHDFYDQSARGLMCRELHGPFIFRIGFARKTKNARTMLFFFHFLPPRLSTGYPRICCFSRGKRAIAAWSREGDIRIVRRSLAIDCCD